VTSLFVGFIVCESVFSELGGDVNRRFFAACFSWVRLFRRVEDFFGGGRSHGRRVTGSDGRGSRLG